MRRTEQILCLSFVLDFCCKFLPCIICQRFWTACQGIFQGPAGCCFCAVCYQLDNLAFPRLWGSKCAHCSGKFNTLHAMDCHRRSRSPLGLDVPILVTSIVQEHDFLGAHPNHTEAVYVHRQLLPLTLNKTRMLLI
jgi:hypothetical protein